MGTGHSGGHELVREWCRGQKAPFLPSLTLRERPRASWGSRSLPALPLSTACSLADPAEARPGLGLGLCLLQERQAGRGDGAQSPHRRSPVPLGRVRHSGRAMSCGHLALLLVTLKRQSRGQGPYYLFQGSNPAQQAETGRQAGGGQSAGPAPTSSPHPAAGPAPPLPSQHPWHGHPHSRHPLTSCPSSTPFSKLLRTPQSPRQGACSGEPPWRASRVPPRLSPAGIICVPCRWPPVRAGQGPLRGVGSGGTRNTEKPSPFAALDVGLRGRWWLGPWRMGATHRGPRRGEGPTSTCSRAPCPHDERTAAPTYVPTPPGPCTPGTLPTHTSCPRSLEGGLPPPRARPAEAREVRPRAQPPHRPEAGDGTSPHSPSP